MALAVGPAVDRLAVAAGRSADLGAALFDAGLDGATLGLAEGAPVELAAGPKLQGCEAFEHRAVALRQRALAQRPQRHLEQVERIGRIGGGPVGHRLGRRHGALAHQLACLEDAPLVAHVGSLEQHARLQDAHAVDLVGPVDQDAAEQPHRVGGRPHQLHVRRRIARPGRADDHVRRRLPAMQPVADIGEVVGEQVHEGVAVIEMPDRRHGQEHRLEREIEPRRRIEGVVVGRRHRPRAMVGELGDVAEAVEPLAQRVGLVDRGLPARAVHLVDREEIDRGAARQVAQRRRRVLGAHDGGRRPGNGRGCRECAAEQRAPPHAARSRISRRSMTKAATSRHGARVQNERARPEGEASTKAAAPSIGSA